jgi:ankyrin repeat protein
MDSTNLALLRSFQPLPAVDELDNSLASTYAVLAKKGFFPPDQIPRLLQHAKDEKLKDLEKVLFTLGVPINHIDDDGNFPIHRACALHDLSLLQYCLDNGADSNQRNLIEDTPLHVLVSLNGSTAQMVRLLISHGADVNLPNGEGDSPLGLLMGRASWKNECIKEDCDILLAEGADPNY